MSRYSLCRALRWALELHSSDILRRRGPHCDRAVGHPDRAVAVIVIVVTIIENDIPDGRRSAAGCNFLLSISDVGRKLSSSSSDSSAA
ncbi:hypothetical protein CYMTET_40954 [Cymbomonas tetramitiformis]|uniref:Uncharacterized protein n=1 Tax=Cymbomonas tetramitiformis TaxID=36881 RepID=A0AAE0C706_9CHLO|nr:hypothetical protein CYMTET_40954 [Cymbomonas tetramitiformis]